MNRTRKNLIKIFQECCLSIVCKTNLTNVHFLDIHFGMKQETQTPYRKPNNDTIYIQKHPNLQQSILKDLPKSISKRISDAYSNEKIFNNHIPIYQPALKNNGLSNNFIYRQSQHSNSHIQEKQKKRKRKLIWFKLLFSTNDKTNIRKIFFKLLRKQFPKTNKLYKIFNRNTVKISCSCVRYIDSIISAHNQRLLTPNNSSFGCNCRNESNCPLKEKCLTPKVIYQADVTYDVDEEYKFYYSLTETSFKEKFRNHTISSTIQK